MSKVKYFMKGGRRSRMPAIDTGDSPREFLHGYDDAVDLFPGAELVETDDLDTSFSLGRLFMRISDKKMRKKYLFKRSTNILLGNESVFNNAEVTVAVTDTLAFGLMHMKLKGLIDTKLLGFGIGFPDKMTILRRQSEANYQKMKNITKEYLEHCETLFYGGKPTYEFMMNEFGEFSHIFDYVPFGVDTEFWHTDENVERGNFALFIGNDANREFEFLVELARSAKDIQFKAVTKRIADKDLPGNFELMQGDWHKELISDRDIRRLYQSAGCCVLPYRETLQPTGQTVALQAMACGCPVIMTRISGLWDHEELKDEENVLLANNNTDEWIGKINKLLNDRDFARHIAQNAKTTLNNYWSYKTFSKSFMDRIALLQNS